jgi:hypothetical protein
MGGQRELSRRIDVVRAEIAGATDESLLIHIGLNDTRMNRVHPDAVAFAGELERGRFGEQGDATLGHRIKRVELRCYKTSDGSEIDDPAPMRARFPAFSQRRHRELGAEKNSG